jgi:hypothetical protein
MAGLVVREHPTEIPPAAIAGSAEAGGKLPVGCPAWHDRAVVVPVVPVAADSMTPSAYVRLKGCRTF